MNTPARPSLLSLILKSDMGRLLPQRAEELAKAAQSAPSMRLTPKLCPGQPT